MKRSAFALGFALCFASASSADAQDRVRWPDASGSPVGSSYRVMGGDYVAPTPGPALVPYSYYAAYPRPARTYQGYGSNDFPFHGKAYGSPNDPWTWYYMGGPSRYLANYYHPPL